MTPEEQFQSELELIKRVTAWVCARRSLRGADAEDFASTVLERLIENNYAVRAKFQGRSSLKTYLTAVINRFYLDFQVQRFGKWRCSAEARRLGTVAVRLERLLYRDGLTFSEACGVLQTDDRVTESREALYALSLKIPRRTRRTPRPGDDPEGANDPTPPTPADAASQVEQRERQVLADRTFCAIRRSLARLPARDRILLRLHLEEGRHPRGGRTVARRGAEVSLPEARRDLHEAAPRPAGRGDRCEGRAGASLHAGLGRGPHDGRGSESFVFASRTGSVSKRGTEGPGGRRPMTDQAKGAPGWGGCPDPEQIAAHAERRLTGDEAKHLDEHIAGCTDCYDVYAETLQFRLEEEKKEAQRAWGMRALWERPLFKIAAAVLLATGVALSLYQLRSVPPARKLHSSPTWPRPWAIGAS